MIFTSCLDVPVHKVQSEAQRAVCLILRWIQYTPKIETPWSMCLELACHCRGLGLSSMHTTTFDRCDCDFKRQIN